MLTELVAALVNPSPRTRAAVGEGVLDDFYSLPIREKMALLRPDFERLSPDEVGGVVKLLGTALKRPFVPVPGPQTLALNSAADELLYGGAAGGGKSRLLLGTAANDHKRSLIVRRQSTELDGLMSELVEMLGGDGLNKVDKEHSRAGRSIKLGGMMGPDDWRAYAGRARDFMGFDEAGEFLEEQVSSILAWLRSTDQGQRCRAIFASNPPRGAEGQWLIEWFAPWLDPTFAGPAKPGELRWFIRVKSKTRWVDGPGSYIIDDETYTARSRTFIPARLDDNPFFGIEYRAGLENLPEPLRSQLLKGDFLAGREDAAWQVIPSDWIQRARMRWTPEPPPGVPMTAIGVDVAQGGPDRTVLAPRYGKWFAPLKSVDGIDTSSGPAVAGLVFGAMRDGCTIVVDMGGGFGGSAYDHLRHQLSDGVVGFVGAAGSSVKSANGLEGFVNKRAEAWWRFREALDPDTGAGIALPPDAELAAELAMPRRIPEKRDIQIEMKEHVIKRLGRSPDKADAVVMAWAYGAERAARRHELPAHANLGYAQAKRHAGFARLQQTANTRQQR